MKSSDYNGWTNYETWLANIWLTNDECTTRYMSDFIEAYIEEAIQRDQDDSDIVEFVSTFIADTVESLIEFEKVERASLTADLLNSALTEINVREIAHAIIEWGEVEDKRQRWAEAMEYDNRPTLVRE